MEGAMKLYELPLSSRPCRRPTTINVGINLQISQVMLTKCLKNVKRIII